MGGSIEQPGVGPNKINVPLHDFYKKSPANPHGCVADPSKIAVFEVELSNSGDTDSA